ncbi:hypothetical protein E4634_20805 [Mangrovimicrobium sediminis]|uniref:Uncharacterized protein n=1 Tax=Mangrovimicrobium sediminis TaxID=2562682 RepID=A0A4Z0LU70_9GAMM|nr:hypothetical protein [Haliea sp. SAOS-164]TGD70747.1 hypothetical protein E4634_20805 [Haliea sp. SAOS-164]
MNGFEVIFTAVITSGVVTALTNWYLRTRELKELRRWELKREACLEALRIVDSRFSDYQWSDPEGNIARVDPQESVSTADVRSCFNKLVLACEKPDVPRAFEACLNLNLGANKAIKLDMNSVIPFRNAIRKELGFGKKLTTNVSWIMYLNRGISEKDT